ncbi:formylmethanofuran dehydrogenase [Methylotenera sp.]|uniref:formylmethanofuran dehydrogenase n=1 Tax=Methylotenera sp. TaxID=2051956 RepID=UPI00248729A9|nr:formylmethanofuran dehydrogenase [Methylotenera sp.]MDI1299441.1 formylmethanofuran dehydrogenase [Methylotenera sp.]
MKPSINTTLPITHCCPACGLLCDDLVLNSNSPVSINNACVKGISFFEKAFSESYAKPSVAGKPTDLNSAIQAAANILSKANHPLFAGLGTEVQGMRSTMRLAEKTSATLDHMHSEGTVRNTLAMQNSGWQTTTLTEIKNRADVILAIGTDIVSSYPRFFEKLVWNTNTLFNKPKPEVMYLGLAEETVKLPEIMSALNALMNAKNPLNKKPDNDLIGGVTIASLKQILEKLKTAKYGVVVWSASALKFPQAELTVQSITQLISKLNETNRVAGLPLNSGDGDSSVNNTSTWLSGYPTRNRFVNGHPEYDAYHFSTKNQLNRCDALLWISTFNAYQPPTCDAPTIVIGHPDMQFEKQPDVFIPVGIPGVDHTGTMFRMDSSVAMPLKKLRNSELLSLSDVISQIEAKLA